MFFIALKYTRGILAAQLACVFCFSSFLLLPVAGREVFFAIYFAGSVAVLASIFLITMSDRQLIFTNIYAIGWLAPRGRKWLLFATKAICMLFPGFGFYFGVFFLFDDLNSFDDFLAFGLVFALFQIFFNDLIFQLLSWLLVPERRLEVYSKGVGFNEWEQRKQP